MVPVCSMLASKIGAGEAAPPLTEGRAFSRKDAVSWDGTGKGTGRVTSGPGLGHSGGDVLSRAVASKPISQMGRGRDGPGPVAPRSDSVLKGSQNRLFFKLR